MSPMSSLWWMALYFSVVALVMLTAVVGTLRVRDWTYPVGALFLTYWSLYGGFWIIADRLWGDHGLRYAYLEGKLFAIHLDYDYALTILGYGAFVTIVLGTVAVLYDRGERPKREGFREIRIDHARLALLTVGLGLVAYLMVRDELALASALGLAGYEFISGSQGRVLGAGFALQQTAFRASVVGALLGIAAVLAEEDDRRSGGVRLGLLAVYGVCSVGLVGLSLLLGEKSELFFGTIVALLAYGTFARRPRLGIVLVAGVVLVVLLGFVDAIRGLTLAVLQQEFVVGSWMERVSEGMWMAATSNEAFGAHFSLYGAFAYDLETEWGFGLMSLLTSVVPRYFWPSRPGEVYDMYVEGVGAIPDQGYTIHHATGWMMTLGPVGIAIGAVVLGAVWVFAYQFRDLADHRRWLRFRLFAALLPALTIGYMPMFIRSGVEGYKGLAIDAVVAPFLLFALIERTPRASRSHSTDPDFDGSVLGSGASDASNEG